jgi:hypothetical protein
MERERGHPVRDLCYITSVTSRVHRNKRLATFPSEFDISDIPAGDGNVANRMPDERNKAHCKNLFIKQMFDTLLVL